MNSTLGRWVIGVGVLGILSTSSYAVVQVGDAFNANFKAVDGSMVSTGALKGKILVVDFWATWC